MAKRDPRPGQISTDHMADLDLWTALRLVADPEAVITPDQARADYLMWSSDRIEKPHPKSKMRAAIKNAGGTYKGTKDATRIHGLRIRPPEDSGYRVGGGHTPQPPDTVLAALTALKAAGLVTDRNTLNTAYTELTKEAHP